jgi:2-succinyl-5-enolpyruvyl-6-hydroxy-3-cyclohexene-1-carboxylate synthase
MLARNRNELWGRVLMDELARSGVRHIVVSPGSRSAPLVLAAAADSRFKVVVQIDERSGAFFALGVGKATGVPAAVVTTSGTAVANLLPAVVEAAQSETPLLVLTADRPPRLRGADANQTIEQTGIFGDYARLFAELSPDGIAETTLRHLRATVARAVAVSVGGPAGPVHLNVPFEKPLEPVPVPGDLPPELAEGLTAGCRGRSGGEPWTRIGPVRPAPTAEEVSYVLGRIARAKAPLLVAGLVARPWETGPLLREVAGVLGIPLLADILSGARFPVAPAEPGPSEPTRARPSSHESETPVVVGAYDLALASKEARTRLRPDLILRVGASSTSANLGTWLSELEDVPHLLVDGGGRWKDHAAVSTRVFSSDPSAFLEALLDTASARPDAGAKDRAYADAWGRVEAAVAEEVRASSLPTGLEGSIAAAVAEGAGPDDIVFASSSMPVRDLDAFVPGRPGAGRPLTVLGNRGASGIDGIVSTAAGVSLSTGRRVLALVGDLALIHDSNGLSLLREPGVQVLIVVVNNDGGGIFHLLPIREHEPAFTPLFATPHGRDLSHLAAFHSLAYARVEGRSASPSGETLDATLSRVLGWKSSGIFEVRTDREENRRLREEIARKVSARAAAGSPVGRVV